MVLLLGIGVIVCGILGYYCRKEIQLRRSTEKARAVRELIAETECVVCDFLEYGKAVSAATNGKYRGTISARLHSSSGGEVGYLVSMYDSGDLTLLEADTVRRYHLELFVRKYGFYYDRERDAIVYETGRKAELSREQCGEMEKSLLMRLQRHPMALVTSNAMIHTRGINL